MSRIHQPFWKGVKRMMDIKLALILLLLFLPLGILILFLILISTRNTPFFTQLRAGKNNVPFRCFKFRTMRGVMIDAGSNEQERITPIGNILRKTGLDELPQLWNIVLGSMSLIGPRPTLLSQTALYDDYQKQRLSIKPGLTGLAQIKGRNTLSWQERIDYDVLYLQRWSLGLDIKILFLTLKIPFQWKNTYGKAGKNDNFV